MRIDSIPDGLFRLMERNQKMERVFKIYTDESIRSEYDWKILIGDQGNWGYTTSDKYEVGGPVAFEQRNTEFKFYAVKGSWRG